MTILKKIKIDNYLIPVLIINMEKNGYSIISLPTQLGCPIACDFCISKENKFLGNLTSEQMIHLIMESKKELTNKDFAISFTGEGEAYLNAKNIQKVINHFENDDNVLFFRICTSGIKINNLSAIKSEKKSLNFQFSMHSPFNEKRKQLIKKTKNLKDIISAIQDSSHLFNEIAINYVLIKDFNDTQKDLIEFEKLIPKNWTIKLNPLIESKKNELKKSDNVETWNSKLIKLGYDVKVFKKIGSTLQNSYEDKMTYELDKIIEIKI